ncbi:MAG: helix-turn-helix domain-containing protein, partial [bacterium]
QVAVRCRILLRAASGMTNLEIAGELNLNRHTVELWRQRGRQEGIEAVWEVADGRGCKPQFSQERRDAIVKATLETKPKGMTHWSCRIMARGRCNLLSVKARFPWEGIERRESSRPSGFGGVKASGASLNAAKARRASAPKSSQGGPNLVTC